MSNKPNFNSNKSAITAAGPKPWWQSPAALVIALIAAAVAVAMIIAAVSGGPGESDKPAISAETGFAEIIGDALPPLAEPDAAVGSTMPIIEATSLAGDPVSYKPTDGVARVIGFFAHWCPHCQAELPRTSSWIADNPTEGVEFVAVSTAVDDTRDNYPPSAWFEREGWPGEIAVDSPTGALSAGFGLTSFPFWVAVDADGTIVSRSAGELDDARFAKLVGTVASVG